MTDDELRDVIARYDEAGEEIAAAEERRLSERDAGLRRARNEGWRPVDLERFTGYSREAIRQALNPEARAAAKRAAADRRASRQAAKSARPTR